MRLGLLGPDTGRVVVVGAGFLGTAIAHEALDRGLPTVVLTRAAPRPALVARGARVIIADAADATSTDQALRDATHVVYCAGGGLPADSFTDPLAEATATLAPLLAVLEALRRRPGLRLTYLSSGGTVYGRPETDPVDETHPCRPVVPYGVSRLAAESYIRMYASLHDMRAWILRLGNVYGPGQPSDRNQGVIAAMLAGVRNGTPVPMYGNGDVARDYVHVDDVSSVVFRLPAPDKGADVCNVATGVAWTLLEIVEIVQDVTGTPVRLRSQPGRPYDVPRIRLSIEKLCALIPYAPVGLKAGITRTWRFDDAGLEVGSATLLT